MDDQTLLARLRWWASDPRALIFPVQGKHGSIAIFPDDVIGKSDEELLAFIVKRCDE